MNNIKVFKSHDPRHGADVTAIWTDPQGNDWKVAIDWKASKSGVRISGLSIEAHGHAIGLTSRLLRQLPLGEIGSLERDFRVSQSNDIKKESFSQWMDAGTLVDVTDSELKVERDFEISQSNDIKKESFSQWMDAHRRVDVTDSELKVEHDFEIESFHQGGHRRVELTALELKKVGMLYVEAKNSGSSTQKWIAEYFKISIPTAARRIRLARENGNIKTNKTRSKSISEEKKT